MNKSVKNGMPKKKVLIIITIIMFALTLVGGTFAYVIFGMDIFNGNYISQTQCFDIIYDNTNDDGTMNIEGVLMPSNRDKGGLSGNISVGSSCGVVAKGNLYLHVNTSAALLTSQVSAHCENKTTLETLDYTQTQCNSTDNAVWVTDGSALKYSVYNDDTGKIISSGYISTAGQDINIYDNFYIPIDGDLLDFRIYIWLDSKLINDDYALISMSGYMYGDASQYVLDYEVPVLDSSMIPVTISDDGVVTTISEEDPNWHDYSKKQWANMVLVNEDATDGVDDSHSRDYYLSNLSKKVEVTQEDILAYYVWIPRYKYRMPAVKETEIDIVFEANESAVKLGNATTEYRTHPAFWWDNDSDSVIDSGEMVPGIWVGKFESTPDKNSLCYEEDTSVNCNNSTQNATILPGLKALRFQTIKNQFATSQNFSKNGNIYGINSNKVNAHMIKNTEWGAVAYLSHSKYGVNQEIYINNSTNYYTGRSGGGVASSTLTDVTHGTYTWLGQTVDADGNIGDFANDRTLGTNASTTGNVTGIFDMSGGLWEYAMANWNGKSGASGFSTFPEKKYYDNYLGTTFKDTYAENLKYCSIETCGGHALYETAGWYGDLSNFVDLDHQWFLRGGGCNFGAVAGIFYFSYAVGNGEFTWRSVLVPGFGA